MTSPFVEIKSSDDGKWMSVMTLVIQYLYKSHGFIYIYIMYPLPLVSYLSHLNYLIIFGGVYLTMNSYVFQYKQTSSYRSRPSSRKVSSTSHNLFVYLLKLKKFKGKTPKKRPGEASATLESLCDLKFFVWTIFMNFI